MSNLDLIAKSKKSADFNNLSSFLKNDRPNLENQISPKFKATLCKNRKNSIQRSQFLMKMVNTTSLNNECLLSKKMSQFFKKMDSKIINQKNDCNIFKKKDGLNLPQIFNQHGKSRLPDQMINDEALQLLNNLSKVGLKNSTSDLSNNIMESVAEIKKNVQNLNGSRRFTYQFLKKKYDNNQVLLLSEFQFKNEKNDEINEEKMEQKIGKPSIYKKKLGRFFNKIQTKSTFLKEDLNNLRNGKYGEIFDIINEKENLQNFCDFSQIKNKDKSLKTSPSSSVLDETIKIQDDACFQRKKSNSLEEGVLSMKVLFEPRFNSKSILEHDPNFLTSYFGVKAEQPREITFSQQKVLKVKAEKDGFEHKSLENVKIIKPRMTLKEEFLFFEKEFFQNKKSIWMNIIEDLFKIQNVTKKRRIGYYRLFMISNIKGVQKQPDDIVSEFMKRLRKDLEIDIKFDFSFRPIDINCIFIQ